jgi:hypothetical protein
MGRWITEEMVDRWQTLVNGPLAIRPVSTATIETDAEAVRVVYDKSQKPVFELFARNEKERYSRGQQLYLILAGTVAGVLAMAVVSVLVVIAHWRRSERQTRDILEKETQMAIQQKTQLESMNQKITQQNHQVEAQTKELHIRMQELQNMNTLMVDREMKLVELKKQLAELTNAA